MARECVRLYSHLADGCGPIFNCATSTLPALFQSLQVLRAAEIVLTDTNSMIRQRTSKGNVVIYLGFHLVSRLEMYAVIVSDFFAKVVACLSAFIASSMSPD
jgi:hypothetical protein